MNISFYITKVIALTIFLTALGTTLSFAEHPYPQPRPGPSIQTVSPDGKTTFVVTPEGHFEMGDPFLEPPGTNFLESVNTNMFDGNGVEMPNTLPSTPDNPYNLHDDPIVSVINPISPMDDLRHVIKMVKKAAKKDGVINLKAIQRGIDIIEGNSIPNRVYSGFPLLHYTGPEKVKKVTPIFNSGNELIGGNVDIHQIWYDSHIESDTAFIDPSEVLDVPWTITYTVDVLNRGHDDFSPMVMYLDDPSLSPPGEKPMPHIAMDQTFFPMEEGTRNIFKIKMAPGKYYNLSYTWGWRVHPPRVQVSENAMKVIDGKTLPEWEIEVFGEAPRSSKKAKLAAIAKIGDLSPAKRMWKIFRSIKKRSTILKSEHPKIARAKHRFVKRVVHLMKKAEDALYDWSDRSKLPRGVKVDKNTAVTMLYVNNTIYGELNGGGPNDLPKWKTRPYIFKATLLNGDNFVHSYMNVDFGGSRGWENQFQSTTEIGGSGCWFTFGRFHWWVNAGGPFGLINIPPAKGPIKPSKHNVEITYNFEPSRRLRIYQFDPLHHDVAVFSLH